MSRPVLLDNLALKVKALSQSGAPDIENVIEAYLERELQGLPMAERLSLMERLAGRFSEAKPQPRQDFNLEPTETARLLSLFLGDRIAVSDLSSSEISEKLANSLNTVFDTLNQIVFVIQSTLLGRKPEIETIRHVIGSQIGGGGEEASLKEYLDQIQHAFLTAHKAFQEAARSLVGEVLSGLDPDALAKEMDSGLKFGPLRKAQLFESYVEKFQECRRWFDSDRFTENLLREFERNCQKTYQERI